MDVDAGPATTKVGSGTAHRKRLLLRRANEPRPLGFGALAFSGIQSGLLGLGVFMRASSKSNGPQRYLYKGFAVMSTPGSKCCVMQIGCTSQLDIQFQCLSPSCPLFVRLGAKLQRPQVVPEFAAASGRNDRNGEGVDAMCVAAQDTACCSHASLRRSQAMLAPADGPAIFTCEVPSF